MTRQDEQTRPHTTRAVLRATGVSSDELNGYLRRGLLPADEVEPSRRGYERSWSWTGAWTIALFRRLMNSGFPAPEAAFFLQLRRKEVFEEFLGYLRAKEADELDALPLGRNTWWQVRRGPHGKFEIIDDPSVPLHANSALETLCDRAEVAAGGWATHDPWDAQPEIAEAFSIIPVRRTLDATTKALNEVLGK